MNGNEEYGRLEIRYDQSLQKQIDRLCQRMYLVERRLRELEDAQSKTDSTSKS